MITYWTVSQAEMNPPPKHHAPDAAPLEVVLRGRGLVKRFGELTAVDRLDLERCGGAHAWGRWRSPGAR